MFKVVISGSKNFHNYKLLKEKVKNILSKSGNDIVIISGHAEGADKLGEKFAKEEGHDLIIYPENWKKHGKSAGFKRNTRMAENADALIAFWDGKSKGTEHTISEFKRLKKRYRIIKF